MKIINKVMASVIVVLVVLPLCFQSIYALECQISSKRVYEGERDELRDLNIVQKPEFGFIINMDKDNTGVKANMITRNGSKISKQLFAKVYLDSEQYVNAERNFDTLNDNYSNRLVYYEDTYINVSEFINFEKTLFNRLYKIAVTNEGLHKINSSYTYISDKTMTYSAGNKKFNGYNLLSDTVIFGVKGSKDSVDPDCGIIEQNSLQDNKSYLVDIICEGEDIKAMVIYYYYQRLFIRPPSGGAGTARPRDIILPNIEIPSTGLGFIVDIIDTHSLEHPIVHLLTQQGVKSIELHTIINCDLGINYHVDTNIRSLKDFYQGKIVYYVTEDDQVKEIYTSESGIKEINPNCVIIENVELKYSEDRNMLGDKIIDHDTILLGHKLKRMYNYSYHYLNYSPIELHDLMDEGYYTMDCICDAVTGKILLAIFDGTVFMPAPDSKLFVFNEIVNRDQYYICGMQNSKYVELELADNRIIYDFMGRTYDVGIDKLNKGTVMQIAADKNGNMEFLRVLYDPFNPYTWDMPVTAEDNKSSAFVEDEGWQHRVQGFIKYGLVKEFNADTIIFADDETIHIDEIPEAYILNKLHIVLGNAGLNDLQTEVSKGIDNDDRLFIYKYNGKVIGAFIDDQYGDTQMAGVDVQVLPDVPAYLRLTAECSGLNEEDCLDAYYIISYYLNSEEGNQQLIHVDMTKPDYSFDAGDTIQLDKIMNTYGVHKIKVLLWSNITSLNPISKKLELSQ